MKLKKSLSSSGKDNWDDIAQTAGRQAFLHSGKKPICYRREQKPSRSKSTWRRSRQEENPDGTDSQFEFVKLQNLSGS